MKSAEERRLAEEERRMMAEERRMIAGERHVMAEEREQNARWKQHTTSLLANVQEARSILEQERLGTYIEIKLISKTYYL